MKKLVLSLFCLCIFLSFSSTNAQIKSAGVKGLWSATTTWTGGKVPTATDNVIIADGDSITFDQNAVTANLTVGEGTSGWLQFNKNSSVTLTVNGNLTLKKGSVFKVLTRAAVTPEVINTITITGNFLNDQATTFDMRSGSSGSTLSVANFIFTGSGTSTITQGAYNTSSCEFNGIEINKTGSGKIVLGSDVVMGGSSSTQVSGDPLFKLTNGIIETGNYKIVMTSTTSTVLVGGSPSSYIVGAFGRGISNSSASSKFFPVGDSKGYRPMTVYATSGGGVTGHMVIVRAVNGNANVAGTTYGSTIDLVSKVRYFIVKYSRELVPTAPETMGFIKFIMSYGIDDGVSAGNANLRMAYSTDSMKTWNGIGQNSIPHTTDLSNPPTNIQDSLLTAVTLSTTLNNSIYVALSRVKGTTDNSLTSSTNKVENTNPVPTEFSLNQNYPNPFNPTTKIDFSLPKNSFVNIAIYNLIGQKIATLVNENVNAGYNYIVWNGKDDKGNHVSTGIYLYRIEMENFSKTMKMVLMK